MRQKDFPYKFEIENLKDDFINKCLINKETGDAALFINIFKDILCFQKRRWYFIRPLYLQDCELNEPLAYVGILIDIYEAFVDRLAMNITNENTYIKYRDSQMVMVKKRNSSNKYRYRIKVLKLAAAGLKRI